MLLLLLASTEAQAPTPHWQWSERPVRYVSEMSMVVGFPLWFLARENNEARGGDFQMKLAMSCVGQGKKLIEVTCEIEHAKLSGVAVDAKKQDMLNAVFTEYEETYENSTLVLEIDTTGRIKRVDLEGPERTTSREAGVIERQRQLATRMVAPLDIQFPKDGDTSEAWKQKGSPIAMQLLSTSGTAGGVRLMHEVASTQDSILNFTSSGQATTITGSDVENGANNTVSLMLSGQGIFDMATGQLVRNEQVITGVPTAQNLTKVFNSDYLNQRVVVQRVDGFDGYDWAK
ncbi:MAG: hypothetical protein ACI9VR_001818 [Cognaticolwellia sp.]|jgi:hypothetical protein